MTNTWRTIAVTRDDISRGTYGPPLTCCPIALALRRVTGCPWVVTGRIAYQDGRAGAEAGPWLLSRRTRQWIRRFDAGHEAAPFRLWVPARYFSE